MKKRIMVKTDDPSNAKFYLTITGRVNRVAEVRPSVVSLSGVPGEALEATVTITPAENYEFKILEMSQKFNDQIKAELLEPKQGETAWQIRVKTYSDKADDLYDIIILKTDSPYKPQLKVRVYAIYFDKTETNS